MARKMVHVLVVWAGCTYSAAEKPYFVFWDKCENCPMWQSTEITLKKFFIRIKNREYIFIGWEKVLQLPRIWSLWGLDMSKNEGPKKKPPRQSTPLGGTLPRGQMAANLIGSHSSLPIADMLASWIDFYWLRKSSATSSDLKSMGSRHVKKIIGHVSHMSQIRLGLILPYRSLIC